MSRASSSVLAITLDGGAHHDSLPDRQLSDGILHRAGRGAATKKPAAGAGGRAVLVELSDSHLCLGVDPPHGGIAQHHPAPSASDP